jgi:PAS domain S-box-containing protein
MIIMGIKLIREVQQNYFLQQTINIREKRWKNLLQKVELFVVGLDKDGSVNYLNPYFERIAGYNQEEAYGKNWFNHFIPENQQQEVIHAFEKSFQKDIFSLFRNSILTKDGRELIVQWSNVILENDQGKVISSLSIGSDITDQEKALEEIRQLKSELEKENVILKAELSKVSSDEKIIGESDALKYVLRRAKQVASTDSIVLLEGETGVGKELIANFIQKNSNRADNPFIKINCAAIPSTLLESELFGHVRGAFTGADKSKKGMVELADTGTLFLDEIGEFPMELQPKLLRFLQDGEFMPLGSEKSRKVDVRIITATNKELLQQIENGEFRNDLYYRLAVYPITIPPLRNRTSDIPLLIDLFVKRYALKHRKAIIKVTRQVIDELSHYPWPGNIRELENVIERAVIISTSDTLKMKDIYPEFYKPGNDKKTEKGTFLTLEEEERKHILKALEKTNWQIHGSKGAATLLGINPSTLRSRMKKLGIVKQ